MCPAPSTAREIGASFSKDNASLSRCDNSCTTAVCGGGVARPTQQRGQGIPVGSNRVCEPALAGLVENPITFRFQVFDVDQRFGRARKDLLQKLLAMHIGYVAQFVTIEM